MTLFSLFSMAFAGPAFEDLGLVLTSGGSFTEGVGAPTVDYDPNTGQYVMYFEAYSSAVTADCATAYSIGRATSSDGIIWTMDAASVVTPDPTDVASEYRCSASQPAVLFDGATWHMLFASAKAKVSAAASVNQGTGVMYASSTDGVSFTVDPTPVFPVSGTTSPSMPTLTMKDGVLYALYTASLGYMLASNDGTGWVDLGMTLSPGDAGSWTDYWIFSPSVVCDEGGGDFPFRLILGGDETSGGARGLGYAISPDLLDWYANVPGPMSSSTLLFSDLKHWDLLTAGDEMLLWYSMTDPSSGFKAIGLGTTTTSWGVPDARYCGDAAEAGGGEEPGDTGTVDTGGDTGADDTGAAEDSGGAGGDSGMPADDTGGGTSDDSTVEDSAPGGDSEPVEDSEPAEDSAEPGTGGGPLSCNSANAGGFGWLLGLLAAGLGLVRRK